MKISDRIASRLMPRRPVVSRCVYRRRPTLEALENRFMLSASSLAPVPELLAGDANQDLAFDQLDLLQVLQAGKYLSGEAATWAEGDWNGAPGGRVGNPPAGDGVFNQLDIMAALTEGAYDNGPDAALAPGGVLNDGQASIVYDRHTGDISIDAPAGDHVNIVNIDSIGCIFAGKQPMGFGNFDFDPPSRSQECGLTLYPGEVFYERGKAQPGLTEEFVRNDLTAVGSKSGGGDLGNVDLVYTCGFYGQDLRGADFSGRDLTGSCFLNANLAGANFGGANLTDVSFEGATLLGVDFSQANLTRVLFDRTTLSSANFTGAVVKGADFGSTEGFTDGQLYSTASYQDKNVEGIALGSHNLSGWSFAGQNLTGARFLRATLTGADFSQASLTGADFSGATLTGADLDGAVVTGTDFYQSTWVGGTGITTEQLYSTVSYRTQNLEGIGLGGSDLSDCDLAGQNLARASFVGSMLTGADLTGAVVTGASFGSTTYRGFTQEQLYSTASYRAKDLQGIGLGSNDLTGWDFVGQNLAGASFGSATLSSAALTDAVVKGADFASTKGFNKEQLYSTASYQAKDLEGIALGDNDLTGWSFAGQNLASASFLRVKLTGADLTLANLADAHFWRATLIATDLRGATGFSGRQTGNLFDYWNAIWPGDLNAVILPDGRMDALDLKEGDRLLVRDHEVGITVANEFILGDSSTIELILDDANWTSTISVSPNVTPKLGGLLVTPTGITFSTSTLRVAFSDSVIPAQLVGATLDLFDWGTPLDPANRFAQVELPPGTVWDLSHLYDTGEIVLTGVTPPLEPGDADQDLDFDQLDIVLVLQVARYLTGESAAWAEGDWNGDDVFNQLDIVAALQTGNFMQGPYAVLAADALFDALGG